MFIKVRRDTLIILILAFILILSGRAMSYVAFASSNTTDEGVPISGIMVKGNDIIPTGTIKYNVEAAGFRDGSYIDGNTLVTSQRQLLLADAKQNAEQMVKKSTIPGTSIAPISAADIQVDTNTGSVIVTVVEDFSILQANATKTVNNSSLDYQGTSETGGKNSSNSTKNTSG